VNYYLVTQTGAARAEILEQAERRHQIFTRERNRDGNCTWGGIDEWYQQVDFS
jgi:hypothetical protein